MMYSSLTKALLAALAVGTVHALPQAMPSGTPTPGNPPTDNSELIAKLKTDPTAIKRFQRILTQDGKELINDDDLTTATVFDFQKGAMPVPGGNGGETLSANLESFPILSGSGMTVTLASLGPCGLFVPHVHPRANEFFTVVDGEVNFGYMLELGLLAPPTPNPEIENNLTKYQGVFFPQGSIHYQVNDSEDCKGSTVLVALSSEDPGTTPILNSPKGMGGNGTMEEMKKRAEGGDIDGLRPVLPERIVEVIDKCNARCNQK